MKPVRTLSTVGLAGQQPATLQVDDAQWLEIHSQQIAAYNAWAETRPTFSESVLAWRESADALDSIICPKQPK